MSAHTGEDQGDHESTRQNPSWDPAEYARFADERSRPFSDLVSRIGAEDPRVVLDLGCGNGPGTLALGKLWPHARLVGVDSSEEMLEAARTLDQDNRAEWVQADLRTWDPASLGEAADVIVTNATLQWVPSHLTLLQSWIGALAPDGWFALQVPNNFDAPSHRLMREVAAGHSRAAELETALDLPAVAEPSTYLRLLDRLGCDVDAWETTYLHVLDPEGEQENPVLQWVSGTGLRPVLDLLDDESEREAFLEPYRSALKEAYPRTDAGVIFPFRRVFAVAHKRASDNSAVPPVAEESVARGESR